MALAPTSGARNGITEQARPTRKTLTPLRFLSAVASAKLMCRAAVMVAYSRPIRKPLRPQNTIAFTTGTK